MKNVKFLRSILFLGLIVFTNQLPAQIIDTNQVIKKIRKQYGLIINNQIEDQEFEMFNNSYGPTEEGELSEGP